MSLVITSSVLSTLNALQEFSGQWVVEPDPTVRDGRSLGATKLRYEISVVPTWPIPSSVVSHLVKAGLPANITAIAERAEEVRLPFDSRRCPSVCEGSALLCGAYASGTSNFHKIRYVKSMGNF